MAPKKKGKRSASGKKKEVIPEKVEPLSEQSKEFCQMQIRDLEGRLQRYQQKWDEVTTKENLFQAQYEQLSRDKKEIVLFLKRTLNKRQDQIEDLNDQLVGLQQTKDAEKDAYEAQLTQVRREFQENKDQLTSENMLLAGKLASLEEFKVQKEELMAKFAALEESLRKQEEDQKELIYQLEKKAVLDKDRLKKEMVQRVNTVAAEFRRMSNNQMAETTKRAIRENVSISSQLTKMSDKSMEMIHENDKLKEREAELIKQLELLEQNETELVKNNLSNQKVIRMLTEKCQQQQEILDQCVETKRELNQLQTEHKDLQEEAQTLQQNVSSMEEEVQRSMQEKDSLSRQQEEERKSRESMARVLGQASESLKDLLLGKPSEDGEDLEVILQARRNHTLQKLLLLLNSAASLGLGPSLHAFQTKDAHFTEHRTAPKGDRLHLSPVLKGPGVVSHYRMGDLGLVPRPDINTAVLSKIGMLSRTTRLGPLRGKHSAPKDVLSLSLEEIPLKQTALPGILAQPANKTPILMAK
ncbi:hypothetical protein FKM82_005595 [Ascaphus truei]